MSSTYQTKIIILCAILFASVTSCKEHKALSFVSHFSSHDRTWIGPEFWANRLQDWQLNNGKLVCLNQENPMRTVHLLNRNLSDAHADFELSIELGSVDEITDSSSAGMLIGAGTGLDYRAAALIHHSYGKNGGLYVGANLSQGLFVRDFETENTLFASSPLKNQATLNDVKLTIIGKSTSTQYLLTVTLESNDQEIARLDNVAVPSTRLTGNIALVSNPDSQAKKGRFWFDNWKVSGNKISPDNTRSAGPVIAMQHTLHQQTLKLTAQLMPIGNNDSQTVELEIEKNGQWQSIQKTPIIHPGNTAAFRIENWDTHKNIRYRVSYTIEENQPHSYLAYHYGKIRKIPHHKEELVVAAFTGNHNVVRPDLVNWGGVDSGRFPWDWGLWFPHNDLINHFSQHQPDLLFFSGDQVYEGASPTWADTKNPELDYLYKWYLWCWAFASLTAEIPTISITDDHDVYHGNIWGQAGMATATGLTGGAAQDTGGYKMPPAWVNMVERTQTSHLPDPFDPTPVAQGIGVYYTTLDYAGVSFAIIEDRKFKSAPAPLLPNAKVVNGWARNPEFNAKTDSDVQHAKLLGKRQLDFLEHWAANWQTETQMKALLSQTIFADVVTLPQSEISDANFTTLKIYEKNGYPNDDIPAADMDSNGWPKTGRDIAVKKLRKAFAVHIAGDQHLGSTIQYGVDEYQDAGYALCVPSIANFYPRRWFPKNPGKNRQPNSPLYTGDHEDGFGNKMSVLAVSNPHISGKFPAELHDKAAGYGIAKFNKTNRTIIFENWPRWAQPSKGDRPYDGWPVHIKQEDNYGKKALAFLPEIRIKGLSDPLIQVYNENTKEIVYTLRIKGQTFKPKVFSIDNSYTISVSEFSGSPTTKTFSGIKPAVDLSIDVSFL